MRAVGFPRCGWLVVFVAELIMTSSVFGSITGSGSITGKFQNSVSTQPQTFSLPWSETHSPTPRASGDDTDNYTWGVWLTDLMLLDGVEMTYEEIEALLGPFEANESEWVAHVSDVYGPAGNGLHFTGDQFSNQPKGETFVAGRLEYSNGVAVLGTEVPSVLFHISSSSEEPDFQQVLDTLIVIETTQNVLDEFGNIIDDLSADYIYFADRPELGSFRVFEGKSTYVEVLLQFNSLDLVGFGNVGDPSVGFVSDSVGQLVPEPASLTIWSLFGLVGGVVAWRKRKRSNSSL